MNDDLYGHELYDGEQVVYVQYTYGIATLALVLMGNIYVGVLIFSFRDAVSISVLETASPFDILVALAAVVISGIFLRLMYVDFQRWWHRNPAIVTSQRILTPEGHHMPLERITKVEHRTGKVMLTGQKLADGLQIRDLPNPKSFCTAIERQLA